MSHLKKIADQMDAGKTLEDIKKENEEKVAQKGSAEAKGLMAKVRKGKDLTKAEEAQAVAQLPKKADEQPKAAWTALKGKFTKEGSFDGSMCISHMSDEGVNNPPEFCNWLENKSSDE